MLYGRIFLRTLDQPTYLSLFLCAVEVEEPGEGKARRLEKISKMPRNAMTICKSWLMQIYYGAANFESMMPGQQYVKNL